MKYVNALFCLVMLLFAAVQYNDPDAYFWIPAYLVPAFWAGAAAYRPEFLRRPLPSFGLAASLLLAIVGVAYYWPKDQGWWRQDVWWESEMAREGMGVMVLTLALVVVAATWTFTSRRIAS